MKIPLAFALLCLLPMAFCQSDSTTDCAKMDFTKLSSTCCMHPFGILLDEMSMVDGMSHCGPKPNLEAWGNSYKINTLQSKDFNNFIDISSKAYIKEVCAAGAFMRCVFIKNSFFHLGNATLNIPNLSSYLVGIAPNSTWKTMMSKILDPLNPERANSYSFNDIVEDDYEYIDCGSPTGNITLLPLMMMQLLQSELIWMCPTQNLYTSKNKCESLMNNFQYCDDKIFSSTAKGVFYFSV
ncbi:Hypothetical predicted protein [Cloeon dipterum]|uniref:Uncharacterized protein n=1 Tax=Cloeon dipterum TaxID=197152 RepID=A0A8S1CIE0_9INSE|nr:Hypothetical predicted protein [Cloeon dipterum]